MAGLPSLVSLFIGPLRRVLDQICNASWGEWLRLQRQLINHYGLNLREPRAKEFLSAELEKCLFTTAPA